MLRLFSKQLVVCYDFRLSTWKIGKTFNGTNSNKIEEHEPRFSFVRCLLATVITRRRTHSALSMDHEQIDIQIYRIDRQDERKGEGERAKGRVREVR